MTRPICYLNGRFVAAADAKIPALDRGFLFGEGLFETWRTYKGRPFAIREHLQRMKKSAVALGIPFDTTEDWAGRTLELARRNRMLQTGGAVRLTITAGPGTVALVPDTEGKPTRLMLFRPLESGLAAARENGVGVHLLDFGAGVNAHLRKIKSLNYLPAVMGKVEAKKHKCFESLYRLADSTVLEGTTSNYFIVKRGRLVTTPIDNGVLPGVTRKIVMRLAGRVADIQERRITEKDLFGADEAFLTSSSIEVVPIVHAGGRKISDGTPGPVTRELQKKYRAHVARRLRLPVGELGE